ncbi:hypothetical protein [Sporosalibacterium faouarense]|uniref:hypothetical protein n=1 Tax=Sporosalibacterium faouarense TaxID=516123 RepID=UPI00192CBD84|nr:hypothetical protein [Sporosalibacterium faouarense]
MKKRYVFAILICFVVLISTLYIHLPTTLKNEMQSKSSIKEFPSLSIIKYDAVTGEKETIEVEENRDIENIYEFLSKKNIRRIISNFHSDLGRANPIFTFYGAIMLEIRGDNYVYLYDSEGKKHYYYKFINYKFNLEDIKSLMEVDGHN